MTIFEARPEPKNNAGMTARLTEALERLSKSKAELHGVDIEDRPLSTGHAVTLAHVLCDVDEVIDAYLAEET